MTDYLLPAKVPAPFLPASLADYTQGPPNAVLTGSHAYGTPREDSDVDLVVKVDRETLHKLTNLSDPPEDGTDPRSGGPESVSIRFGRLNLILEVYHERFDGWAKGTAALIARAPVTREEAKRVLKGACGDEDATC